MHLLTHARLTDADPGADLSGPDVDDSDWVVVPLPGDVHLALAAAGRVPSPHSEAGDDAFTWMEEREWWYRIHLPQTLPPADGERLRLHFAGLDTDASVYVDGRLRARSQNMFRALDVELSGGESVVALCFHRPLAGREGVKDVRKAQFSYGWDFAPRRPGIGVWRPVELRHERVAVLTHVRFQTLALTADHDLATVQVDVGIDRLAGDPLVLDVVLRDPHGVVVAGAQVPVVGDRVVVPLSLRDPRLWWSSGHGEPALHDLEVSLRYDDQLASTSTRRVGLRTIALDQSADPDEPGTQFFRFVLNGLPVPVKGANWVPADTSLGATDPAKVRRLLGAAHEAHMNMVRVWGGGVYESDDFLDTCDALGLMVWHDLMFACAEYRDDDDAWLDAIAQEVREQADRISSHPCLALWCGNNEVELLADALGWSSPSPGQRIFYETAPSALADTACGVPYLASSPALGNSHEHGDRHNWDVWHGVGELDKSKRTGLGWQLDGPAVELGSPAAQGFYDDAGAHQYLRDKGRFVSEYGLASAPSLATLEHHGDGTPLTLEAVQARLRPPRLGPRNKLEIVLDGSVGLPTDAVSYVELSQLAQAEGVKTGAEHFRRRWPHCGGSLVWQLDDCWPSVSWAMIDVDEHRKPLWHYLKRSFAPVLASFAPTADGADLWVSNDTREPFVDEVVVRLATFAGEVLDESAVAVEVPASTSLRVGSFTGPADPHSAYLSVRSPRVGVNRHFFTTVKDLARTPAPVEVVASGVEVVLTSASFHLAVTVRSPGVRFDDEYFDLEPGVPKALRADGPVGELEVRSR